MKRNFLFLLVMVCCFAATAQKHKPDHLTAAVTTLHTAFPFASFSKLFTEDFHPGLELGTGFNWRTKTKHDWFQAFQVGYSYHRFVQHSIALYSDIGYRYKFLKSFNTEARLGLGYMHVIPTGKIFKLSEDGNYEKKANLGRPQVMAGFSLRVNKAITTSGVGIFVQYQQRIQFPFIKSYVPLLPSNMVMLGVKIPCSSKTDQK